MGCHTWTYKKLSAIPEKEKSDRVNKRIVELENWWGFKRDFENVVKTVTKWGPDHYGNKTPEQYASDMIQEFTDKLERLKTVGWDEYVKSELNSCSCDIVERKGELYYLLGCNIPFRLYGYPEEVFTDKPSLISFLKKNSQSVKYYFGNIEREGYSGELENMINEFFEKHGENNLWFEFG